ncbi:MAG: transposase, partial [Nitrososphaeraceae archaeon]
MGSKRPQCKSCNKYLTAWGKTAYGKKRYGCHFCKTTRVYHKTKKQTDFFVLFRQYVLWGHTYEQISDLSGYSIQHLSKKFHIFLLKQPPELPLFDQSRTEEAFLVLDGLWLKRGFVLMAYRQSRNLTILHISVVGREAATKIAKDLRHLLFLGYHFSGIVSDGGTGIVKAVGDVFLHAPHQICLAHLHRDVINAIGRYPKNEKVKDLKRLADHVWLIESKEALRWWTKQVHEWVGSNNAYLKEKKYDLDYNWWFIHKGVRHAASILQALPDTSFTFLDYPLMPKTTNEIEAQFGHLGKRWLSHRGLKTE